MRGRSMPRRGNGAASPRQWRRRQWRAKQIVDGSTSAAKMAAGRGRRRQLVQPTVRSEFADTALWVASLETNKDGIAEVELDMPQNLTAWKIRAWGMGHGTRVGEASAEVVTRKNLIVRMQAPRFFVETRRSRAQRQRAQLSADREASEGPAGAGWQHARTADRGREHDRNSGRRRAARRLARESASAKARP